MKLFPKEMNDIILSKDYRIKTRVTQFCKEFFEVRHQNFGWLLIFHYQSEYQMLLRLHVLIK